MKRVVVLTPTTEPTTGWGRYSQGVIEHLRDAYELTVITDLPSPTALFGRPHRVARAIRQVRAEIRDADALLSLVAYPYSLVAYLATRGTRTPYFVCCHGSYAVKPLHDPSCIGARKSLAAAAALFPVSEFTGNRIRDVIPGIDTIYVTKNGIQIEQFERTDPFDLDHRVMLTVGPLKQRKGQLQSVRGFARVADDIPDVHYHLVGGSGFEGYRQEVLAVVETNGLDDRVHFGGFVAGDDLRRWYETADVFALTSQYVNHRFEGFPLVYLEAQRYGTPAIGIETTSGSEAISHDVSGLCVANDPAQIGGAIRDLFTDEDRRERLAVGATEWALSHPWSKVADVLVREIDAVID